MERVFTSAAPWVVGREALLEYAIDDFLRTMARLKPWLRARYEALLEDLNTFVDTEVERPAPLTAFSRQPVDDWMKSLSAEERPLAESALSDFADYLVKWGWLEAHPLRQPQAA